MSEFRTFVYGLAYEIERLLLHDLLFARTIIESILIINLMKIKDNIINYYIG
jgi:hypothetical protein